MCKLVLNGYYSIFIILIIKKKSNKIFIHKILFLQYIYLTIKNKIKQLFYLK